MHTVPVLEIVTFQVAKYVQKFFSLVINHLDWKIEMEILSFMSKQSHNSVKNSFLVGIYFLFLKSSVKVMCQNVYNL